MTALSTLPEIKLANGTVKEQRLREVLSSLFVQYPLSKWQYADVIRIEEGVLPHSHPVLTLSPQTRSTNYLTDAERLLGTYIHEQIHWFLLLETHAERSKEASAEFRKLYPRLPIEPPRGCGSDLSTYLHIQVNYLEYLGLSELLGVSAARRTLECVPFYTAVYALILEESESIGEVMKKHGLIPNERPPKAKRFAKV